MPGRDAYQQRDALAKALVEALGGDEDLANALADDDKFVDAVRAMFESPKSLGSQPGVLDAGACDEQAFVAGAARRRAQTTGAVDWEAMHPSATANTLTLTAGTTATFTWTDNHDVWEFASEADYNSCNFAGAVEKASTSVQTVDVAAPTTVAQTKYYGCKVSDHCTDGQKIAISWTDADGCLSDEKYKCDSNCDENCSRPASKSTTPSHYSSLQATATVTKTATNATKTATKTTREIPAGATNTAVTTTATASVTRAVMRTATETVTEAATARARARTPTPRRARRRPGPFSSRSPRCSK